MTADRAFIIAGQITLTQHGTMLLITHPTRRTVATVLYDEDIYDYVVIDGNERWASGLDRFKVLDKLVASGYITEDGRMEMEMK